MTSAADASGFFDMPVDRPLAHTSYFAMPTFTGFPKQTLTFLRGLSKHNEKAWFDEHRAEYDAYYIAPAKALVEDLGTALTKLAPELEAEPRVNGSIFRINRDVRFSKDKTPYKDHLDLWLWEGADRKQGSSGFYLRLTATSLVMGVGMHGFPKPMLAKYQAAVLDDDRGKALASIAKRLEKKGLPLEGVGYKKVPRGFDADHPRAALLRHKALHVGVTMQPLPDEVGSAKLIGLCRKHFKDCLPLHQWLVALAAA